MKVQIATATTLRSFASMALIIPIIGVACLKPTSKEKKVAGIAAIDCETGLRLDSESDELVEDLDELAEPSMPAQFALLAGEFYDPQVKNEMMGKCATAGCHVTGGPAPTLMTYAQVRAAADAILATVSAAPQNPMPRGVNNNATTRLVVKGVIDGWKANGLLEKAAVSPGTPTPTPTPGPGGVAAGGAASSVTFNGQVKTLLKAKCGGGGCHPAVQNIDIENAAYVKDNFDNVMSPVKLAAGDGGIMPPAGKLPAADIKLLDDWKAGGFVVGDAATPGGQTSTAGGAPDECVVPVLSDAQKKAIELLKFPEGMKKCSEASPKTFFDRKKKECLADSVLITETCDKAWVEGAIAKAEAAKKTEITTKLSEGWTPEQCATQADGKFNLFYMIKIDTSGDAPKLQSKGYQIPR